MVSIITPVYNRVDLFKGTCRSILAQTYSNFEWIIVDDGSEEDLRGMLDTLKDPRIKYFKLPHSGKLSSLHNFGIKNSSGEFVILPDSDDLWRPNALELMVNYLEKDSELGIVVAETEISRGEDVEYPNIYKQEHKLKEGKRFFNELLTEKDFVFFTSAVLFRRSCLDRSGMFDESLRYGDKNFFTRLAFHFKAKITNEVLVKIRKHDQNVTASTGANSPSEESFKEEIYTVDQFFLHHFIDAPFHKKMLGVYYFKLAEYYYRIRSFADAKEAYAASLKRDGRNFKARVKYFLSIIKK